MSRKNTDRILYAEYKNVVAMYPGSEYPVADYCIKLMDEGADPKSILKMNDSPDYHNYRMKVEYVGEYADWRKRELERLEIVHKQTKGRRQKAL